MLRVRLNEDEVRAEIERICLFLSQQLSYGDEIDRVVIGVSGGVDSDVVARLALRVVGADRIKLFTAIQEGMDPQHLSNAQALATELGLSLAQVDLTTLPFALIQALHDADPGVRFRPNGLIDPSRAKCSIRTPVFSTYLDRGYLVLGSSNRTELETGFFLPLGDGLGHVKPIVHLYKSQVYQLAEELGTAQAVLQQPASSGFWVGAEDLQDLAFWLFNEAPIGEERTFTEAEWSQVLQIRSSLTTEKVDLALLGLSREMTDAHIADESSLPVLIVERLRKLTTAARRFKQRPLNARLQNLS